GANPTFGLKARWSVVSIMRANGYTVLSSSNYESLFVMLAAHRFDALPRGIGEATVELNARQDTYPQLTIEKTRALFFPYPIYFWVNHKDAQLAAQIERGLEAALAACSLRQLSETS